MHSSVVAAKRRLYDMLPGEEATVFSVDTVSSVRRRLSDLGMMNGASVRCVGKSPGGDPSAFWLRGAVIALRAEDTKKIQVCEPLSWD